MATQTRSEFIPKGYEIRQTAYIAQINLLAIYNLFMQNKPNVKIIRHPLNLCLKRTYRKFLGKYGKKTNPNKPKTNPIQSQFKPNFSPNEPNSNPNKPNFSRPQK